MNAVKETNPGPSEKVLCSGITKKEKQCRRNTTPGSKFCSTHNPVKAKKSVISKKELGFENEDLRRSNEILNAKMEMLILILEKLGLDKSK